MDCPDVSKYATNGPLKVLICFQLTFAISALISLVFASKRVFSSFLLDTTFKEHLFLCYIVHFIQASSSFCSQGMMLFQYVTQPVCSATFSNTLCIYLRISTSFSIIALPILNLALNFIRVVSYFGGRLVEKHSRSIRRIVVLLGLIMIFGEQYWKYYGFEIPEHQVAYCVLNSMPALLNKLNAEGMITIILEASTLLMSFSLFALYHRRNKLTRSYDISVTLARRQLMETWQLFLPYSVFHAISFFGYQFFNQTYRNLFINRLDPVTFAAGSGFVFIPMYFVTFSPWVIYWIVARREKGRLKTTNALINLEAKARNVYFETYRNQWEIDHKHSIGFFDFCQKRRNKLNPSV